MAEMSSARKGRCRIVCAARLLELSGVGRGGGALLRKRLVPYSLKSENGAGPNEPAREGGLTRFSAGGGGGLGPQSDSAEVIFWYTAD